MRVPQRRRLLCIKVVRGSAWANPECTVHPRSQMKKISILSPGKPAAFADAGRRSGSAIFSPEAWKQIALSLKLSGRELQIVQATFDAKTELAMALDLQVSPSTIHTHMERLHHKLSVSDRAQLLLRIIEEFLALTAANVLPPICSDHGRPRCPRRT
jgi:DNA-binding NarL/FixJ family response regulator